jgi:hypothetical protein
MSKSLLNGAGNFSARAGNFIAGAGNFGHRCYNCIAIRNAVKPVPVRGLLRVL